MDSSVDISDHEDYFFQAVQGMGDQKGSTSQPQVSKEHSFVQDTVKTNHVVMFSKSSCPHCDDSKTLLNNMGISYKLVELDKMEEGNQVQNVLGQITDARTVPRIFIDGQCVGGNSDLKNLNQSGDLNNLLNSPRNI